MKNKGQVDIHSGIPLLKNKSFTRQRDMNTNDFNYTNFKKTNLREKIITLTITIVIMGCMLYFSLFVGLKNTNFFGVKTKNVQTLK